MRRGYRKLLAMAILYRRPKLAIRKLLARRYPIPYINHCPQVFLERRDFIA